MKQPLNLKIDKAFLEHVESFPYIRECWADAEAHAGIICPMEPAPANNAEKLYHRIEPAGQCPRHAGGSVRKTILPINEEDGRAMLAVPINDFIVDDHSASIFKTESVIELDDLVTQKVNVDGSGCLSYELAPYLRDLLLGISAEGKSTHVGGSSLRAVRNLRKSVVEDPCSSAPERRSHARHPDASEVCADAMMPEAAGLCASIVPAAQQAQTSIPLHSLVFDMPVEKIIINPSGMALLCSPAGWGANSLAAESQALDCDSHESTHGDHCTSIVPYVGRPLSAREARSALRDAALVLPSFAEGETTAALEDSCMTPSSQAIVPHVNTNGQSIGNLQVTDKDIAILAPAASRGPLCTAVVPYKSSAGGDLSRPRSALPTRSSSVPRILSTYVPQHELRSDPIGVAFRASASSWDASALAMVP